jgi:hypothetical protein
MFRLITFAFIAAAFPLATAPSPGAAVVLAAYRSTGGKWFRSAQWVQRTTTPQGANRLETWYVTVQPPGLTRVDVAPGVTGRLLLYRGDSTYTYGKGQLRGAAAEILPLYVLLHDLHSAPPQKTIKMLTDYGFDLKVTHEQSWQGERVIVVGAAAGDTASNQFWLEKKRMVLVRLIERNGSDPRRPLDAQISGYEKAGAGWLERTVRLSLGGQLSSLAEYTDVVVNGTIEPGLFNPAPYHLPQWVHGAPDIFGKVPNMLLPGGH